ncbi:MAG: hypothetical protein WDN31_10650 [Hyphomicrobium sp.]
MIDTGMIIGTYDPSAAAQRGGDLLQARHLVAGDIGPRLADGLDDRVAERGNVNDREPRPGVMNGTLCRFPATRFFMKSVMPLPVFSPPNTAAGWIVVRLMSFLREKSSADRYARTID